MAALQTVSTVSVSRGFLAAPRLLAPVLAGVAGALALSVVLSSCGGGGGGGGAATITNDIKATLQAVHQGRLVDVWGLVDGGKSVDLYQADVLIGPNIDDQRKSGSTVRDQDILYDFVSSNPENLQPRLLITREIGSPEFQDAFEKLDDEARDVAPAQFGRDTSVAPYPVVPRNAALRLTFSRDLQLTEDFFVQRVSPTQVTVKNTEAVQLLKIQGDPNDTDPTGDFQVIPSRVIVKKNVLMVDPVLLGNEGLQFGVKNVASGMPASPDQSGANIRLAVALAGPLRIPGIADNPITSLSGLNNSGEKSIIRDFRSGNTKDNSSDLSRGFVRDPLPPRVIGQMRMFLEQVDSNSNNIPGTKVLRIFKNGINHEIDRGDVIRLIPLGAPQPEAVVEILTEPTDDLGKPEEQHVSVVVRQVVSDGSLLEGMDPTNPANSEKFPGYPGATSPQLEEWLRNSATRAVLVAEYTHERPDPNNPGQFYGDDSSYFVTFNPTPIQDPGSTAPPNQDVSPFAGAVIRFNKPVDMTTVRGLDSMFFATRDLTTRTKIEEFLTNSNMAKRLAGDEAFLAKFRTPHLVFGRTFNEDGSQTAIRLQPTLGFYMDDVMRTAVNADRQAGKPVEQWRYNYVFHLVGGSDGVRDLSGNELDFQAASSVVEALVLPFSLDTRVLAGGTQPRFTNNIVAYVVRRFADEDEDERPSLYIPAERPPADGTLTQGSFRREDMFGPVAYLGTGQLLGRTAGRLTRVVDNLNQLPPPPQTDPLRWCPQTLQNAQVINPTATVRFGAPLQNPLNPFGCRLQTVWREIDMSLSRTDGDDFNLDVEQMYWAPFTGSAITFDEFDQISLFLGHSEYRPEPCINAMTALPSMPASGLKTVFAQNYAFNNNGANQIEFQPVPHPAYVDAVLTINGNLAITEPNEVNRYLPLPNFIDGTKRGFRDSLFVYRDETVEVQGGVNGISPPSRMVPYPYIISPFMGGRGNFVNISGNSISFNRGGWYNGVNQGVISGGDGITGGLVGPIALPLLADFWTYPDSASLPKEDPFRASGANGWQVSLAVTSSPRPDFRAFSAGFRGLGGTPTLVGPSHSQNKWTNASGGFTPSGGTVQPLDNTVYWIMVDFLKRTTVATNGFVEITNPHRMPTAGSGDPRLGPYTPPKNSLPDYAFDFEPPLSTLPAGTSVVPEFRGAGVVDSGSGFPWQETRTFVGGNVPTAANFPLDPLKAGDAWIRHWDERTIGSQSRRSWTYLYNRNLTAYTEEPNNLATTTFTNKFGGPNEVFAAEDVKYFNWRFIMRNNVTATPPVSPLIESFAVSYRFVKR
ncbi:MAG: hypothetical protein ACYTGW_08235 [Planctomycetota bacterium]|jgi:hypothetical protein